MMMDTPRAESGSQVVTRVLIAEDHALVREALRILIASYPDLRLVGEANDGAEAVNWPRSYGLTSS